MSQWSQIDGIRQYRIFRVAMHIITDILRNLGALQRYHTVTCDSVLHSCASYWAMFNGLTQRRFKNGVNSVSNLIRTPVT